MFEQQVNETNWNSLWKSDLKIVNEFQLKVDLLNYKDSMNEACIDVDDFFRKNLEN